MALIVTICPVLVFIFTSHSDAWSPTISQGSPRRHIALHLEFTGKVNGVMTQGDYVAGQISQDPTETDAFAPLTACSVLDLKQEGEDKGWVGLVNIEGEVRGKAYNISIESDFRQAQSRGMPRNTYDITTYPPQYPSAAAALHSKNGTVGLSFATTGSTFTVGPTGRSGTMDIAFTGAPQQAGATPAVITVRGSWSCG